MQSHSTVYLSSCSYGESNSKCFESYKIVVIYGARHPEFVLFGITICFLSEAAKANNDRQLQDFCCQILEVYDKNKVNGHIVWERYFFPKGPLASFNFLFYALRCNSLSKSSQDYNG